MLLLAIITHWLPSQLLCYITGVL